VGKLKKAGLRGRPRIPVLAMLGAALALVAGLAPAALASPAASPAPGQAVGSSPDGGVVGNASYCDRDYERLDGDLYIAYNDDSGDYTCLQTTDQQKANGFRVTTFSKDIASGVGAFPNIFAGFEWSRHPKNSFLPVEERQDGNPLAAVSVKTVQGGDYNAAYDIWFNKTDPYDPWSLGDDNGTEVMIWLVNHEGSLGAGNYKIDGDSWRVMKWIAKNHRTGVSWHYIAFIAPSDITSASLQLNPFFNAAIALGWLSPSWYLTNVGFGFEMFSGALAGLAVNSFSLQDLNSGTIPKPPAPKKNPVLRRPMPVLRRPMSSKYPA
jgi:hypothetical protein